MTSKRNYSRYFIILQEDEKGYAIDQNKFPTGYAKVERKNNKCRVSYYVQNLKKSKDPYYMLLICDRKKDKRLIKLGKINIDDYGRSEISYEYDINNVANCNIPMDNIKGASIVKIKDSNVHGILTGFVSGTSLDDWKSYVVIEEEKREETKNEDNKKNNEEIKREDKKSKEERAKEENIFDKYEKEVEEHKKISIKEENVRDLKEEIVENKEKLQEDKKVVEEKQEIKSKENRLEKIEDKSEEIKENKVESDEEEIKDKLEKRLKENIRDYINEEDSQEEEEDKDIDQIQNDEDNNRENNDFNKEDDDIQEDKNESEENTIEINDEDTRKCKNHKKDKKNKKEELKSKEKKKDNYKDNCDNKNKYKDKEKKKSKEKCFCESNCHMNWEKEFYKHIVEGLQEEKDICQEIGKCHWYKIHHTRLMNMKPGTDFSKYSILYYPMMNYYPYIMKREHYIVGFKHDKNGKISYIVYGIPGNKSMMDQPFNGATGFVTWVNRDISNIDPMNMGYWLMFYDFKNSTVVIPIKK